MDIRGLTALITGASGFIGGRLAERLATEEGVRVRAMVRNTGKPGRLGKLPVKIVRGDLLDFDSLIKATARCDLVFHSAGFTSASIADKKEFSRTIVEGTENVVKASLQAGVKKFIHMSSVAVYGLNPPDGADENTPYQPCGHLYCDTKIAAEEVVWAYHQNAGLPVVIIRPANVYGPHSRPWTIRPINMVNSGQVMLINGGTGLCNCVYIDNLIDAIVASSKRDEAVGHTYVITDGIAVTWKEFFGCYAKMAGKPEMRSVPLWLGKIIGLGMEITAKVTGSQPRTTREAVRYLAGRTRFNIEKARRELGYEPRVSLTEGMQTTEKWLREEGYLGKTKGKTE